MATDRRVFISHIHEEQRLGKVIKRWIEETFPEHVTAFLSSDRRDLPAGKKWRDVIIGELDGAAALVALISPASLTRSWINIEFGAAMIKGVPIIPLCHSGQEFTTLPAPFSDYNGAGLDQPDVAERLLEGLGKALGLTVPRVHFAECRKEMLAAAAKLDAAAAPAAAAAIAGQELPADQQTILKVLASAHNTGREDVDIRQLPVLTHIAAAELRYHIQRLRDLKLIRAEWYSDSVFYSLSPSGSEWIITQNQGEPR